MARLGVVERILTAPHPKYPFSLSSINIDPLFLGGHHRLYFPAYLAVNYNYVTKCWAMECKQKCQEAVC